MSITVRAVSGLVAVQSLVLGCGTSYVPAASPRVSIVMSGGAPGYVRDGETYEGGMFGGDIEEAVRGNPRAEQYAHEYKRGLVTGFALTMLGLAGVAGGVAVVGADTAQSTGGDQLPTAGLVLLAGGLVVELVGTMVTLGARPHLLDAINAYNDGLLPTAPQAGAP